MKRKLNDILTGMEMLRDKEVSEKAVETLSDSTKIKRYSNIDEVERTFLHRLVTANILYFNNDKDIDKIVDMYLELSLSVDKTGISSIVDLFKTNIITEQEKE